MSRLIPKEKLTAYQRWELASFDEVPDPLPGHQPEVLENVVSSEVLIAAELEKARQEGYAAGLQEGRQIGLEDGRATGIQEGRNTGLEEGRNTGLKEGRAIATREAQNLQNLAAAFAQEITRANELIAQDMLDLSLDIAKAMLHSAFEIRPEIVLPVISEAIRYLPAIQQPAQLFLHPDDAPVIRQYMDEELSKSGWRIAEDAQVGRGGCRVETASNQIDATTPTRWHRICSALGKDNEWLAT